MRVLDKYLYKELFATFFAVLSVLLLIVIGTEAVKLLTLAVQGKVPPNIVLELILLKIPAMLEVVLPLVALLSVMLAVGRLYQDLEMVVLQSCGVPFSYFQKRVVVFLIPVMLLTAWSSLYLTPWSFEKARYLTQEAQETTPLAGIVPGKFNLLPNNQGVLYAQSIDSDFTMHQVWLKLQNKEQDISLMAPTGRFEYVNDRLAIVLMNGESYEGMESGQNFSIRKFERFEGFLPEIEIALGEKHRFGIATKELVEDPTPFNLALLEWRIVLPFSVMILGLIGLKMSETKPREGRFAKIFLALVVYIIYNQLLMLGREGISNEEIPAWIGLWPIPILFFFYAISRKPLVRMLVPASFFKAKGLGS